MKWIGFFAAVALIVACFFPWIFIESNNIMVSGVNAEGTNFGRPAYFHFFFTAFFLLFNFTPKVWAKRSNLLITALNLAWAIRNYFIITACRMGDCPEKQIAIYVLIPASLLMLIAALFPDVKMKERNAIE